MFWEVGITNGNIHENVRSNSVVVCYMPCVSQMNQWLTYLRRRGFHVIEVIITTGLQLC